MEQYPPPEEYEAQKRRIDRFMLVATCIVWAALAGAVLWLWWRGLI